MPGDIPQISANSLRGALRTAIKLRVHGSLGDEPAVLMDKDYQRVLTTNFAELLERALAYRNEFVVETGQDEILFQPLITLPTNEEIVRFSSNVERILETESDRIDLQSLTARQFEELVAEIWHRFGFEIELTPQTRDGGRDIIAISSSTVRTRYLIECKRFRPDRKVSVEIVRALYGVKVSERATKAILATTSTFTRDASAFFEQHIWELEGRDYDGLLEWIAECKKR